MYFLADEAKEIPIYIAIPLGIVLIIALFCLFFIVSRQSKNNYNKWIKDHKRPLNNNELKLLYDLRFKEY